MDAVAALGIVVWFVLVALLWYARPGELAWLAGSLALGFVFFTGHVLVRDAAEMTG